MPDQRRRSVARYAEVLSDRLTGRLLAAATVSAVGDFIGSGALIILAYERAGGRAVGAAGFLAATGMGAVGMAVLGGPLLDRVPRRRGLVGAEVTGAIAVLLALLGPGLWPIYVSAFLLGLRRSAEVSIRHGMLADAVPDRLRSGLLAALGTTDQFGQVLGFLAGASLAVTLGADVALVLDLVTFVVAAVVLTRLTGPTSQRHGHAPSFTAGWRGIFGHRQLRLLCLLISASAAASALPETLAPAAVGSDDPWLPVVLAAGPAGGVIGFLVAGRIEGVNRFVGQLVHLTLFGVLVSLGALASGALGFTLVNIAAGAGSAWILGPQVSFVRLADQRHVAQIAATMAAVVMVAEGGWVLVAGAVADAAGVHAAYLGAAGVVLAAAVVGWTVHLRRGDDRAVYDIVPSGVLSLDGATARDFERAG